MSKPTAEVFDELYHQYKAMVYQLCIGFMKGDRALADDLVQEIFVNTWNALSSYRAEASYKTWIYRIAVNTCLQYIRKHKQKNDISLDNIPSNITECNDTDNTDRLNMLYNGIAQLEDVDRLVIMMVLDEMEYDEISKIIGITEANLRVKIHRIKQRLKKILTHDR